MQGKRYFQTNFVYEVPAILLTLLILNKFYSFWDAFIQVYAEKVPMTDMFIMGVCVFDTLHIK